MLVATVIVALLLNILRLPEIRIIDPLLELIVHIAQIDELPVQAVPAPEVAPVPVEANERVVDETRLPPESASEVGERSEASGPESVTQTVIAKQPIDWETEKAKAVKNAVDEMEESYSVNPGFDEQRDEAAVKFRPSEAPVKREIWENVEKDELGRTLLRKGDCFRVLDDPSAVNQWAFNNFDQYITYCTYRKYVGKDLEWVKEIHQRFAYLRNRIDRRNGIFVDD